MINTGALEQNANLPAKRMTQYKIIFAGIREWQVSSAWVLNSFSLLLGGVAVSMVTNIMSKTRSFVSKAHAIQLQRIEVS